MKVFKNKAGGRRSFSEYRVFKDIHVPILVFQANALHKIYRDHKVTRADFLVLAAGYAIQKNSLLPYFDSPELTSILSGIGHNILFKSLRRLIRLELISLKVKQKSQRKFVITPKGK